MTAYHSRVKTSTPGAPGRPRAPFLPGRPLVLGHRGASADAPENTLAAFRLALDQGADGFELDVWRCGTGEPVVIHDEDARRTAGARLRATRAPLAELRRLDVGAWKGPRWRGERVPLLAEVLEALPGAVVNVELKSAGAGDPRLAFEVARMLTALRAEERVVVSSFDYLLLAAFRAAAPQVPTGLLFAPDQRWELRERLGRALLVPSAVHPERTLAAPERIAGWLGHGLGVAVWTVDAPEEAEELARHGVTAIITNAPARVREAVRAATGR